VYSVVATLVVTWIRVLMRWRIDVRGLENVPRTGGALVTFNHHSYSDFFMCVWAIYREVGRPVRFLAKQELFDKPILGWIFRSARMIPVARASQRGRRAAFAHAVQALERGELIAIAPEQTISRSFELLPLSSGTVRMAQQAQVPIVPSVNWGTQRFATKGRPIDWGARRIPVLVRYGEPFVVAPDESLEDANDRLRAAMEEMLRDLQRRYPDQPRGDEDAWWQPRRLGGTAPPHEDVLREHQERERSWRRGREQPTEDRAAEDG
jgi:1-acyl-sn-glycerol-3-phosphate acyltransferase